MRTNIVNNEKIINLKLQLQLNEDRVARLLTHVVDANDINPDYLDMSSKDDIYALIFAAMGDFLNNNMINRTTPNKKVAEYVKIMFPELSNEDK